MSSIGNGRTLAIVEGKDIIASKRYPYSVSFLNEVRPTERWETSEQVTQRETKVEIAQLKGMYNQKTESTLEHEDNPFMWYVIVYIYKEVSKHHRIADSADGQVVTAEKS